MLQDSTPKEPFETSAPRSRGARLATWLRGAAFLALLLALAGLLAWFLVIVPLQRQVSGLSADLAAAQGEIATLQASRPLQEVYSLLADANTARFELMRNRSSSASAALLSSEQTLASLRTQLGERYVATLDDVQERLELVKADIASDDMPAALSDLEVLVNILTQLQRTVVE